ncbi:MAG: AbrB family transcriptional regulator [Desulfurococcales archaeon ex4484_217_1]|nr:MAG: AbrB family transcriptional regulator [Desulfurococcales archaeon ex4484_217_1]
MVLMEEETLRVRVGKRFTITIPKKVREKLSIKEGDELDVILLDSGFILKKPTSLIEFIDNVKPAGTIKMFLKERDKEGSIESGRVEELTE